ncbi:MAG TPA: hypothetical protein GX719_03140 [Gammaproteobacteria bacterium]|nr:hypothetical protein [Gammaproteobacteria bacterium]
MRQPDIEIYVKDADRSAVSAWLSSVLEAPCSWQQKGRVSRCQCANIPLVWFEKAVGSWHSLLLESASTPWIDDAQCAQAAAAYLNVNVRCAPGSWQETDGEADADRWLQVSADGHIENITWYTS